MPAPTNLIPRAVGERHPALGRLALPASDAGDGDLVVRKRLAVGVAQLALEILSVNHEIRANA